MMRKHLLVLGVLLSFAVAISAQTYSAKGYHTYTISNATFKWATPDTKEGGLNCTSAQGMAVGEKYCYVAKHKDNAYADVHRINMSTGDRVMMRYYAKVGATSESECNVFGHANELEIVENVGPNGETYLFVATLKKPHTVVCLKVVEDKMYLAGSYEMIKNSDGGTINASALKHWKTVGSDMYFIVKNSRGFYAGVFPLEPSGTVANPTHIQLYKLFDINVSKTVFATSNSAVSHRSGINDWANQGFGFSSVQNVIYVPVWQSTSGSQYNSAIITYNVEKYIKDANWTNKKNLSGTLYPTKTQFMMSKSAGTFEIETASFKPGKTDKLYFNTNTSSNSGAKEGVYEVAINKTDFTTIPTYTIKYNANGGTGSMSNTVHVEGVASAITANAFTRSGYTFNGWFMHRKSDDKWLYFKADGSAGWYKKGSQPADAHLATRADKHKFSSVTSVVGDVITLYADWKPNAISGSKCFYIRYDANGGTGTMGETKVVYGTSTTTASNTFTREGYTFVGWVPFRYHSGDKQWGYKNTSTWDDTWLGGTADKTGYIYKTYASGAGVAKTTSVDTDVVTFYAAWAQVAKGVVPVSIVVGSDFQVGGTLTCTTDMYGVKVNVKDKDGAVVQSYTAETFASRTTATAGFDVAQANSALDFSKLALGTYTYEVIAQTTSGATPRDYVVHSAAFEVVPQPVPVLSVSPASVTFDAQEEGYASVEGKTVSVTGENLTAVPTVGEVANFTIASDLALNGGTITIRPNDGLAAGTYAGELIVTSGEESQKVAVSFTVEPTAVEPDVEPEPDVDEEPLPETPEDGDADLGFEDNITEMTEVWNFSATKETAAAAPWLNIVLNQDFTRDVAVNGNSLYVLNGKQWGTPSISIVDAYTGVTKGSVDMTGIDGGRADLAAIDMLGDKLIGVNAVSANHELVFYKWEDETSAPTQWAVVKTDTILGDQMSVTGDMTNGAIWLVSTPASVVYKFTVTNGEVNAIPTIIPLSRPVGAQLGCATLAVAEDGTLWVDGKDGAPMHFKADGTFIEELSETALGTICYKGANAVELFAFGKKKYMIATNYVDPTSTLSGGAFTLVDLTDGVDYAVAPMGTYPAAGLGGTRNTQFINALTHTITDNGQSLYVWVAVAGQGVACYHYKGETIVPPTATAIEETNNTQLTIYQNGTKLCIEGVDAQTITLYTLSGQKAQSTTNSNNLVINHLNGVFVVVVTDSMNNRHVQKVLIK